MATRRRNTISTLVTTLQTITSGNGYQTTVANVRDYALDFESAETEGLPWLGIDATPRSTVRSELGGFYRCVWPMRLIAHVRAATSTVAFDACENLLDDIIVAINVDHTLGGNCVIFKFGGAELDASAPDRMDARGGTGTMVVHCEAIIDRQITSQV